jgi:hypothetical protein
MAPYDGQVACQPSHLRCEWHLRGPAALDAPVAGKSCRGTGLRGIMCRWSEGRRSESERAKCGLQ